MLRRTKATSRVVVPSYKLAQAKVTLLMERVNELEALLDINGGRWAPGDPQYDATLKYIKERKYRLALDELERLVVQRLFELQKTNIASTGEQPRLFTICSAV